MDFYYYPMYSYGPMVPPHPMMAVVIVIGLVIWLIVRSTQSKSRQQVFTSGSFYRIGCRT